MLIGNIILLLSFKYNPCSPLFDCIDNPLAFVLMSIAGWVLTCGRCLGEKESCVLCIHEVLASLACFSYLDIAWMLHVLSCPLFLFSKFLFYLALIVCISFLFLYCSAGKSFVAEVLMLRRILSSGNMAILVLPYVSICAEKVSRYLQLCCS